MRRLLLGIALLAPLLMGGQGFSPLHASRVVGGPPPSNFVLQDDASCLGLWIFTTTATVVGMGTEQCTTDRAPSPGDFDMNNDGGTDLTAVVDDTPAGTPAGLVGYRLTSAATVDDPMYVNDVAGSTDGFESDNFTLGCWVKPTILTSSDIIITKDANSAWEMQRRSNNVLRGYISGDTVESPGVVFALDTWVHVAQRYDGGGTSAEAPDDTLQVFVNGVLSNTAGAPTLTPPSGGFTMAIGSNRFVSGSFFDGTEFECWYADRVLDADEICDVMLYGADGNANNTTRAATFGDCTS